MSRQRGAGGVEDVEEIPWEMEGPGWYGEGGWRPIRVAFTRWYVSGPVKNKYSIRDDPKIGSNWDGFSGYYHRNHGSFDSTHSFLGQCGENHSRCGGPLDVSHGRFLHREEMNLHPEDGELEMYDRLVGRMDPGKLKFLNEDDTLPLVHIIVNKSDLVSKEGRGRFDLFFPHRLHYGRSSTIEYVQEYTYSVGQDDARKIRADAVGACHHCASEMEKEDYDWRITRGSVLHMVTDIQGTNGNELVGDETDDIFGYREFGQEITKNMVDGSRRGGIIVDLPRRSLVSRIFLPRWVLEDVFGPYKQFDKMKIYPPIPHWV